MLVKTGYGYITDVLGNIVAKYDLPKGEHPTRPGYTFIEVKSKKDLDKIEVYKPPLTDEQKIKIEETKIIRKQAIASLLEKGEIAKDPDKKEV